MIPCVTILYGCNWFQNLLSVPVHLAVATGHLSSPLLFPDQVTYPGRIRPRLCTLHSFLTSFLFSMPGGSWTVSSLACKCICASSVQWSMSVWMCFSSFLLSFLFPWVVSEHVSLLTPATVQVWWMVTWEAATGWRVRWLVWGLQHRRTCRAAGNLLLWASPHLHSCD